MKYTIVVQSTVDYSKYAPFLHKHKALNRKLLSNETNQCNTEEKKTQLKPESLKMECWGEIIRKNITYSTCPSCNEQACLLYSTRK